MELEKMKERILFFKNNIINVFIKKINGNYYFAKIQKFDGKVISILNIDGKRIGSISKILIIDIDKIEERMSDNEN